MNSDSAFQAYYNALHLFSEPLPRVPVGYVEGSMLYNSNGDGVVSGYVISADDEWIVTCCRSNDNKGNLPIIGTGQSKTDSNMALWLNATTNLVEFTFGDGGKSAYKVTTSAYDVKQMHTYRMKLSTGEAWIDGDYVGKASSVSSVPHPKPLALFGSYRGSSINSSFKGACSDIVVLRNGEEVAHWVPVDGGIYSSGGMYDIVRNEWTHVSGIVYFNFDADWNVQVNDNEEYSIYLKTAPVGDSTTLDWGDGTVDAYAAGTDSVLSHTYASAGRYALSLRAPYGSALRLNQKAYADNSMNQTLVGHVEFSSTKLPHSLLFGSDAITSIALHGRISTFEAASVRNCSSLAMSSLPTGVTSIGNKCYMGSSSITIDRLPDNLIILDTEAFRGCSGITIREIPASCTAIGNYVFHGCSSITSMTFKGTPTSIGTGVFNGCTILRDIYVPWDSSDEINANAPWGATNATIHYNHTA